jgi:hypothetical protein
VNARFFDMFHHAAHHSARSIRIVREHRCACSFARLKIGDNIDVDFGCVVQEAIDEDWRIGEIAHVDGRCHVRAKRGFVGANLHAATAEHVTWAHEHGVSDAIRAADRFFKRSRDAARRLLESHLVQQCLETIAIFREVDRIKARADKRYARLCEPVREIQRCLPPNCTIAPTTLPERSARSTPPPLSRSITLSTSSSVSGSKKANRSCRNPSTRFRVSS